MKSLTFGSAGVDWQERIDFPRMREERLARTKAAMKKHGLATLLLTKPDNMRYATSTKGIPGPVRYALVFAEHDPIMYEIGDTLEHSKIDCPWIKPETWRVSFSSWGGMPGQAAVLE